MRLAALRLRVTDPDALAGFYRDMFAMTVVKQGPNRRLSYAGMDADILLMPGGGGYVHDNGHRYWKIGITVPDVDLAAAFLERHGQTVSVPHQFLDIGYMCHLKDPQGFSIELLQHDFKGNRPEQAAEPEDPFKLAQIGQITLRTGNIAAEDRFWRAQGMSLLSIQDVAAYGFDLHFYAFTEDAPPMSDLWAVENREWLWKRPYTTLEFQHVPGAQFATVPDFRGLEIEGLKAPLTDVFGDPLLPG
ncbi:MAG: VOC family protein [Pseudomonadota bacterium]